MINVDFKTLSNFGIRHHIFRSYRGKRPYVFMSVEEPFEVVGDLVEHYRATRPEVYITSFVERVPVTYRGFKRVVNRVTYIFKYPDSCLDSKFMYYLL